MSSNTVSKLSTLQALPTELTEMNAENLDQTSMLAFASTSRAIRYKIERVYRKHEYNTLKFCMYPNSLHTLTEIAASRHAQHVDYIVFEIMDFGLIDPIHDGAFIQGHKVHTTHYACATRYSTLRKLCMRVDAEQIAAALVSFAKLKMILVGDDVRVQGQSRRSTYGVEHARLWECPGGQCKTRFGSRDIQNVLHTVTMALNQARPQRPEIELGLQLHPPFFLP
jgi:hypothetical protein